MTVVGLTWVQGGAIAVLVMWAGYCLVAILTGRLLPRANLVDLRADQARHEERLYQEIADWRQAYQDAEKAREALTEQVRDLKEVAHTQLDLIRSLVRPPEGQG